MFYIEFNLFHVEAWLYIDINQILILLIAVQEIYIYIYAYSIIIETESPNYATSKFLKGVFKQVNAVETIMYAAEKLKIALEAKYLAIELFDR